MLYECKKIGISNLQDLRNNANEKLFDHFAKQVISIFQRTHILFLNSEIH